METSKILITRSFADYELIDSGEGEKLERFGKFTLSRPDPQALWAKRLLADEWKKADGCFTRDSDRADWTFKKELPDRWGIDFAGLKFWIKPTAFKHVGLFPEQAANWEWLKKTIKGAPEAPEVEVLNLFGYTGGATLACAQAGAKVVHIDGSKSAMASARENAELSGLKDKPVRWIIEDARLFVEREIRRGRAYDGIIMDPPAFGHGPDNELWKIEEHFLPLIEDCKKLLKPKPLFFLVNGYSAGYSPIAYENNLISIKEKFGGTIEVGELTIEESQTQNSKLKIQNLNSKLKTHESELPTTNNQQPVTRLLPCGIFARWSGIIAI